MPHRNRGRAQVYFTTHVSDVTSDCMIWPFNTRPDGYGIVTFGGRVHRVHVLACERNHGAKPTPGHEAAHGPCHNPACWNWQHLSWKTRAENDADKLRDGTHYVGAQTSSAKLSEADVLSIRAAYATGAVTQQTLADRYGLSDSTVCMIVKRKRWTHI